MFAIESGVHFAVEEQLDQPLEFGSEQDLGWGHNSYFVVGL